MRTVASPTLWPSWTTTSVCFYRWKRVLASSGPPVLITPYHFRNHFPSYGYAHEYKSWGVAGPSCGGKGICEDGSGFLILFNMIITSDLWCCTIKQKERHSPFSSYIWPVPNFRNKHKTLCPPPLFPSTTPPQVCYRSFKSWLNNVLHTAFAYVITAQLPCQETSGYSGMFLFVSRLPNRFGGTAHAVIRACYRFIVYLY